MKTTILFLALSLLSAQSFGSDELKTCTPSEVEKTTEMMTAVNNLAVSYEQDGPSLAENQSLKEKCDSYLSSWARNSRNLLVPCATQVTFANGSTQTLVLPRSEIAKACEQVERVLAVCAQSQNCL